MKLQNEILKAIEKYENNNGGFVYRYTTGIDDYYNMGVCCGQFIKFYNDKHFYVNFKEITSPDPVNAKMFTTYRDDSNIKEFKPTGATFTENKHTLIELMNGNDKIYLDEKYVNYFTSKYIKVSDLTFYSIGKKAPVYIEIDSQLRGLIMPVVRL